MPQIVYKDSSMKIKDLSDLPKISVFALFNPKKNKVHLMYAKNTLIKLAKFIDELKYNKNRNKELCDDVEDLEVIILETYVDESICRMHMNYWYDYVTKVEQLELYSRYNYLVYKPRITVSAYEYDYLNKNQVDRVYVEFINARNEGTVVGVFNNIIEAEEFKASCIDTQEHLFSVYACNELTKEYVQKKELKKLRM